MALGAINRQRDATIFTLKLLFVVLCCKLHKRLFLVCNLQTESIKAYYPCGVLKGGWDTFLSSLFTSPSNNQMFLCLPDINFLPRLVISILSKLRFSGFRYMDLRLTRVEVISGKGRVSPRGRVEVGAGKGSDYPFT